MPLGIVSDDDFKSELDNSSINQKPPALPTIIDINRGRGNQSEVPESLRKIIGETSAIDGRQEALALAKSFGISPSSVSAYGQGATSTSTIKTPDIELKNHIGKAKERISKKARAKLFLSLKHITETKLEDAKPEVLASIARNMSAIVKEMEPDNGNDGDEKQTPQFVVFAPQFRDERTFETITVKE